MSNFVAAVERVDLTRLLQRVEGFEGGLDAGQVGVTCDLVAFGGSLGEKEEWRQAFEETKTRAAMIPKVGLMRLENAPGKKYAVAIRKGSDLWLTLWIRRAAPNREIFVMVPRGKGSWNPHASYHLDGRFHHKSYGRKMLVTAQQALTGEFHGSVCLGMFAGHAPEELGAVCDRSAFAGVVEVPTGVLGPRHGFIAVDLVEPGVEPPKLATSEIAQEEIFRDEIPWLCIRVGS